MARYFIDHGPASAIPAVHLRTDLACRGPRVDPEWFYPGRGGVATQALEVCRSCPAVDECRDWALDTGQQFGVWGATTGEDRERIRAAGVG
jgi:WhiB family redox-sensing transcriptional regulator